MVSAIDRYLLDSHSTKWELCLYNTRSLLCTDGINIAGSLAYNFFGFFGGRPCLFGHTLFPVFVFLVTRLQFL